MKHIIAYLRLANERAEAVRSIEDPRPGAENNPIEGVVQ